jgi:hypothetical protein
MSAAEMVNRMEAKTGASAMGALEGEAFAADPTAIVTFVLPEEFDPPLPHPWIIRTRKTASGRTHILFMSIPLSRRNIGSIA